MKSVKSLALAAALLLGAQAMQAEFTYAPHEGVEPSVGGFLLFGGKATSVEVGAAAQIRVADWVRLAPEVTVGVPAGGYKNCFSMSVNVHSPWSLNAMANFDNPRLNVYPIVGFSMRHTTTKTWKDGWLGPDGYYERSYTGYGLNLGAGAEILLTDHIKANVEFMESWMSNELSSFPVKFGIQYVF